MKNGNSNHSDNTEYSLSNPKPLSLIIEKRGFIYSQLLRGAGWYLYEQRDLELDLIVSYELFKKKVKSATTFQGKKFPDRILWPHDEAFGTWAWSFSTLKSAMKKYLESLNTSSHA